MRKVLFFHRESILGSLRNNFSKKKQLYTKILDFEQNLAQNPWIFDRDHWKNMKLHVLIDFNHQNRSKTIKNREIHPGAFPEFFSKNFGKYDFSHIFQLFGSAPWRYFRDFARSAMQSTLPLCIGHVHEHQTMDFGRILRNFPNLEFYLKNKSR